MRYLSGLSVTYNHEGACTTADEEQSPKPHQLILMEAEQNRFWELIDAEKDALWRLSRGLCGSYDEALDLMSETFLAAHKSFSLLRDPDAFRQFLSTIAVRLHRRKRWRNRLFISLEDADDVGYESNTESSHDLDLLLVALNRLPLRQREGIVLFEITGLSLKEIQQIQSGTVQGVKSRLNRARHNLKQMLADENFTLVAAAARFKLDRLPIPQGLNGISMASNVTNIRLQ